MPGSYRVVCDRASFVTRREQYWFRKRNRFRVILVNDGNNRGSGFTMITYGSCRTVDIVNEHGVQKTRWTSTLDGRSKRRKKKQQPQQQQQQLLCLATRLNDIKNCSNARHRAFGTRFFFSKTSQTHDDANARFTINECLRSFVYLFLCLFVCSLFRKSYRFVPLQY